MNRKTRSRKGGIATLVTTIVLVILAFVAAFALWQWYNSWATNTQRTQAIVVYDARGEFNISSNTLTYTVLIGNNGQKTIKLVSARDSLGNIFAAPASIAQLDGTALNTTILRLSPGDKYMVTFQTTYTGDPTGMTIKLYLLWDDGSSTILDIYVNAVS